MTKYGSQIRQTGLAVSLAALAAGTTARADYSSTVLSFNPAAYWRLNETTTVPIADQAINGGSAGTTLNCFYRGTAGSTYTHPTTPGALSGSADGAVTLSGNTPGGVAASGYLSVPYSPSLNTSVFTAEAWLNPTDIDGTLAVPLHCAFACGDFAAPRAGWLIYQSGEGWNLRMYNRNSTTTSLSISGGGPPTPGTWYHVAVAFDGTTARLYINGAEVASGNPAAGPMPTGYVPGSAGNLTVGTRSDGFYGWNGQADEVACYTNALSASVIAAHYSAATTNGAGYATQILANNPVAYYRLNEPTYTPPDPSTLPIAVNTGTTGADANGTYQPGTATLAVGPPYAGLGAGNHAGLFSGIAGNIDCGNPVGLNISGSITIMTWIKVKAWDKSWQSIVTKGDGSWRLHRNSSGSDTSFIGFGTSGLGNVDLAGTRAVNDGLWHQVVAVYDGSAKYIYIDGTLDAQVATTGSIAQNTYAVLIGANAQVAGREFNGIIDEVAILTNALSAAQVLQVYNAATVPPVITQQPQAPTGTVYEGSSVSLQVAAVGNLPLAYQWTKNTTNLVGKTAPSLALTNVRTNDSGNYAVVVTNAFGSVTSSIVALSVQAGPPIIFQQPQSLTRYEGGWATFSVVVGGSVPLSFQWNHGSTPISGATQTSLTLSNLQTADAGNYVCTLTNPYGSTNTTAATLTLLPVTNYAAVVMAGNPVAYFRLDETSGTTARDNAGGHDGTASGGVTVGVNGPQPAAFPGLESTNKAREFDGVNATIGLPPLYTSNNNMTITCWIKPNGPQISSAGLVMCRMPAWVGGFNYGDSSAGDLRYTWDGNQYTWSSGLVPVDGQWNFVALVIEPGQATIYLDGHDGLGLRSAVHVSGHTAKPFDGTTYLGQDPGYGRWFKGTMDEVAIYNRALSPTEIQNLGQTAVLGPTPPTFVQLPQDRTTYTGGKSMFSAQLNGATPFAYQWLHAGTNLPGATLSSLTLSNVSPATAGSYVLRVTNPLGVTNSPAATLTVVTPVAGTYPALAIAVPPVGYWRLNEPTDSQVTFDWFGTSDATVQAGITMGMDGVRPPDNRGFEPGNLAAQFDGYTAASVVIPPQNVTLNHATFACWVKRNGDQATRTGILIQRSVDSGVKCTGLGFYDSPNANQLSYSWNDDYASYHWNPGFTVPDQEWTFVAVSVTPTNATLYMGTSNGLVSAVNTITHAVHDFSGVAIDLGRDNYQAARVFNGTLDEVTFHAQALSPDQIANLFAAGRYAPTDLPVISQEPASREVLVGEKAVFSLTASGGVPWTYQWRFSGTAIAGATNATYAISSAYYTDAGNYQAVVKNAGGSVTSAVATLTVRPPPSYANLTNDLVLHLRFDGNYLDTSGRANDGTPVGTLPGPTFVAGKIGSNAVHVDSEVDTTDPNNLVCTNANYVTLNSPADLQFGAETNFSVAYWVKMPAGEIYTEYPVLCDSIGGTYSAGCYFGTDWNSGGEGGGAAWWVSNPGKHVASSTVPGGPFLINDGNWHHIAVSFDRMGLAVTYLDGVPINSISVVGSGDFDQPTQPWNIGQDATGTYPWSGVAGSKAEAVIDDIGIWRRALTAYEALGIYNAAQSGLSFDVQAPVKLYLNKVGGNIDLSWQAGTLLQSTTVNGPYSSVSGATAPFYRTSPTNSAMFYRVRN
jgi:hypothetical protein